MQDLGYLTIFVLRKRNCEVRHGTGAMVHASPEIVKGGWLHYGEYNGEICLNSRNDEYKIFKYMGI